jgi:hypothetical protein
MAGKHSYAHAMSIKDVATGGDEATRTGLDREIGQAIAERRFAAVVVSTDDILPESYLSRYYTRAGAVFPDPGVFVPVAGYPIRPESIYFPKR